MSLTGLRSLGRRRLPLNLRVTHGPAILANGIPGGSPTRAPRSLGPSEPPFPPFGEAVPGSIGRPLCPSDRGAAPSLERGGRLGPPWAARPPGAGLRPCRVLVAGRGRGASGGEVGVSGRRVPGDGWERYGCVCVCVCDPALGTHVGRGVQCTTSERVDRNSCVHYTKHPFFPCPVGRCGRHTG